MNVAVEGNSLDRTELHCWLENDCGEHLDSIAAGQKCRLCLVMKGAEDPSKAVERNPEYLDADVVLTSTDGIFHSCKEHQATQTELTNAVASAVRASLRVPGVGDSKVLRFDFEPGKNLVVVSILFFVGTDLWRGADLEISVE